MPNPPNEWSLVTAEVRNDKGKFVNSTWGKINESKKYWITIGFGDVIQTIVIKENKELGFEFIKEGELYEFVSKVNQRLMSQEV